MAQRKNFVTHRSRQAAKEEAVLEVGLNRLRAELAVRARVRKDSSKSFFGR